MMPLCGALIGPAIFDPGNTLVRIKFQMVHNIINVVVGDKVARLVGEYGTGFARDVKDQIFFNPPTFHHDTTPFCRLLP